MVAPWDESGVPLRALKDETGLGLVSCDADRLVEQRLVVHNPTHLESATRGEHDFRLGIVDPGRELFRGEASEYH